MTGMLLTSFFPKAFEHLTLIESNKMSDVTIYVIENKLKMSVNLTTVQ